MCYDNFKYKGRGRIKAMKKRKSTFISICAIVCAIVFASCGEKDAGQPEPEGEPTTAESNDDGLITVGFALSGDGAGWSAALVQSVEDNCTEENGIHLIMENAEDEFDNQVALIRSFIEQKVDAIGFTPIVSDGWDEVLQEAKDAGIPVIMLDRTINTEDDTCIQAGSARIFCWKGIRRRTG